MKEISTKKLFVVCKKFQMLLALRYIPKPAGKTRCTIEINQKIFEIILELLPTLQDLVNPLANRNEVLKYFQREESSSGIL